MGWAKPTENQMSRLFKRCHKWWDLKHCDTGIFQRSPGSFLVPRNPCRDMILLPVIRQSMWSRRGRSLKKIANLNLIYSHAWWITLDKTYICKYICKYIHIISSWYFWKYKRYTNHGLYSYYTHHIIMVGSSLFLQDLTQHFSQQMRSIITSVWLIATSQRAHQTWRYM